MCRPKFLMISVVAGLATIFHCAWADWSYPDTSAQEGRMMEPKKVIQHIHSENTDTVSYGMSGDYKNEFIINKDTGIIYQVEPLDRETKDTYELTVTSSDANGNPTENPVSFKVNVLDINDEAPVFVKSTLVGTIEEGHPSGPTSAPFMRIEANDRDKGFNGVVNYRMVSGSDVPESESDDRFIIDSVTGNVRLIGVLDYEANPEVRFKVEAVDNGASPHVVPVEVVVKVTDSNDHAPKFGPLPEKALSEVSKLNTPLFNMYATDEDEGVNKKVYFEIIDGNTGGAFTIVSKPSDDSQSLGQLQLVKPLDFESGVTSYDLNIKAFNKDASNSADEAYYSTTVLKITVIDANEPPIFRNTPYTARVDEGEVILEPIPVIQIVAEDIDFNGNQSVTYSLSDPEDWFYIDAISGHIGQKSTVDREAQSVKNGVYHLTVIATDNYDHGPHASGSEIVDLTIKDINDNPPMPDWNQDSDTAFICEKPRNSTFKVIKASDPDSAENGPEFSFRFDDSVDSSLWGFERVDEETQNVVAKFSDYGLSSGSATVALVFTLTDSGTPPQTGTATLSVTICKCADNGEASCSGATAAGLSVAIIIAIIAVILLIAILVFAVATYKRRQDAMILKEPFFDDEDDVRETVQVYQEECGEEDQAAYDLSALRAPLMEDPNQPVRKTVPLQQMPRRPPVNPSDDISNIIGEAKDQADGDPSAPPFDSLLVFDYEGAGSDAGSLSSINTATTDGSMDYDYLNEWGPRFKRLADMYNDGSDSE